MSKGIKEFKKYKERILFSWFFGIGGVVVLSGFVYFDDLKLLYFLLANIIVITFSTVLYTVSKNSIKSYFNSPDKFKSLIANNQNYFFEFYYHNDILNFRFKNDNIGGYIIVKLGVISKYEGIVENNEEILTIYFEQLVPRILLEVKISAPTNGLIDFNQKYRKIIDNRITVGDDIFSIKTSLDDINNYINELEKSIQESIRNKDEQTKLEIRERLLEKERKNNLEKEVREEMFREGSLLDENSESRKREPIPQEVQDRVWRRDGGKCVKCGSNIKLEFDHIIPFSKGGANTYRNLQLLCENCNRQKSNKIG